jgi:hypothetical protein
LSSLGIIISSCTIFYNINKIDVKGARKWKREYGDASLICGQNLKKRLQKKVETWNELQHSYSLSSLRDFKKKSVLYDDVTKAFEIRSNEFKYVLTKKQCVVSWTSCKFRKGN